MVGADWLIKKLMAGTTLGVSYNPSKGRNGRRDVKGDLAGSRERFWWLIFSGLELSLMSGSS